MEMLDVVDEQGNPTGEVVTRERAHREGIRHRTAHVWIIRQKAGRLEVLLQKRSANKDSYPGCYDISSAGHIPAGADFLPSALRELQEELGVTVQAEALIYCGLRRLQFQKTFHGRLFKDNQVTKVYDLWLDEAAERFTLQQEEVEEVRWFDFEDCVSQVREQTLPNCIYLEELELVRQGAERSLAEQDLQVGKKHP